MNTKMDRFKYLKQSIIQSMCLNEVSLEIPYTGWLFGGGHWDTYW